MKEKFIRIISPATLLVVIALDLGVIGYGVFAIRNLAHLVNAKSIIFALCIIFAVVVAVLTTIETVKHGVIFRENELEFTGLDSDNIFEYDKIVNLACVKDEKASFVKNFIDRQSRLVFTMDNNEVTTIDIGITTKNKLNEIEKEIRSRMK